VVWCIQCDGFSRCSIGLSEGLLAAYRDSGPAEILAESPNGGYVHGTDLFTLLEIYAVKSASTAIFLLWIWRALKREFKRDD